MTSHYKTEESYCLSGFNWSIRGNGESIKCSSVDWKEKFFFLSHVHGLR